MRIRLPKVLRDFSLSVEGRGYAGVVEELTPPKLVRKAEDYQAGGMPMPIKRDQGMEGMELTMGMADYDRALLISFGFVDRGLISAILRGYAEEVAGEETQSIAFFVTGGIREIDWSGWKAGDKAGPKISMALTYCRLLIDESEVLEIDALGMIYKVGGIDLMSARRRALGG